MNADRKQVMKELTKWLTRSCYFVDRFLPEQAHDPRNHTKSTKSHEADSRRLESRVPVFPFFLSALIRVHLWLAFVFASQTNSLRYDGPMRPKPRQLFWLCQLICTSRAPMS